MGARCTFVFKQKEDLAVALYSHWGEDSMHMDLAQALQHATVRKGDTEYYTRMAVSHLLKDSILDETGFGLYACNPSNQQWMDHPILIDLTNNTISDETGSHDITSFINYHLPSTVLSSVGASSTAEVGVTSR
jgi:hypothetical protein